MGGFAGVGSEQAEPERRRQGSSLRLRRMIPLHRRSSDREVQLQIVISSELGIRTTVAHV